MPLINRQEHTVRGLNRRAIRGAFGPRKEQVTGDCMMKSLMIFTHQHILLTKSMEQSLWEANRSSVSQDIPRILWNPKVHHRIHTSPSPVLPWARSIPPTSHLPKIYFNDFFPSTPKFSKWSISHRSPHKNPVYTYPLPIHATLSSHPILDLMAE